MIVRSAELSEMDIVVDVLTEAFHDDPVSVWVFPDEERRPAALTIFHRAIVRGTLAAGGSIDVTGDLSAAVLWTPSGEEDIDGDAFAGLTGEELGRLAALFELMTERAPSGEYHHAQFIGVRKSVQRQGIGGWLLRHGLDRNGTVPAYLEASSPESAKLYRRLGFRDHGPAFAVEGGPPMLPMWREP
ncbi:GNAT family N-acetyltransferase [Amycolatopsis azurea]|uniref:GCN5-related N-acetyltransferase n=1 Tax=Amycolatopsis azurea DSM 43854 TaxID=1238180 RepID=M2PY52_9PSEU|nr:GNAT family N-acetyltransferase [Amycolatopsis azurea]EMD24605.1 GCN5-related N-acetyltransferase [Amycolatopsis azurea DSM 43854]OOC02082.1 GNAT family N-acetyltransferase [Amycolatopsis azurea DSM 43854]